MIEKRDRAGKVRCACTVEEGGVRYKGTVYKSLSGAALARMRHEWRAKRATSPSLIAETPG